MKTISKEFEGIYGNGGPLGMGKNVNTKNMLNRIPNKQYQNNVSYEDVPVEENVDSGFPVGLFLFFILVIVIGCIYYFRNDILNYFNTGDPKEKEVKDDKYIKLQDDITSLKARLDKDEREMNEKNNIKVEEEKNKKTQEDIKKGGVQQLDDKLNTVSGYKQEQLVKENSYCYIGTENGQRECTNAYAGDVCMSGQIFPKMEICINPRLRI
jgi:hypothetical protein